jgi:hypothetical protein
VACAGGGDTFLNTGKEFIEIANGDSTPTTVTIAWGVGGTIDGITPTARTVSVTNATSKRIGPFPPSLYNDANGYVSVTYSKVTSLTAQVVQLSQAV